ncbi:NERD domain-containing protein [Burkholderia humptydooensis]|uniref:NERD domain-containing protein n=3 Tax=Burkholderiaceae TaxID=119060 RepID=A0A7T2X0U1_9BURK|nr:hypothetical protein A33K_17592 [Burkholderia humptydooensis MSMB43]QPS46557.1 NERD domain-containing protein [Burkholderia humptydooensis]
MSSIELYCGAEIEPDSEKRVLIALFEHLDARGLPAVVLSNFTIGRCQIDFLVGTESTTLLLEVKGFRVPVIGFVNGSWSSVSPDGSLQRERNGWDQALKNKYAVRKRLGVEMSGRWIPYPNAAVLFEAGIAPGSMFDEMDHEWVAIRGIERLGELLAARAGEPWPLDWLRLLAGTLNLDRSTLQLAVAGPARSMAGRPPFAAESPRTFEPSGAAAPAPFDASAPPNPSQPFVVPSTIRTDEGLPRALPADVAPARRGVVRRAASAPAVWSPAATSDAHAARSSNAAARPGLPSVATAVRPARGERARRLPLGVFVLLSAAAFVWRSDTRCPAERNRCRRVADDDGQAAASASPEKARRVETAPDDRAGQNRYGPSGRGGRCGGRRRTAGVRCPIRIAAHGRISRILPARCRPSGLQRTRGPGVTAWLSRRYAIDDPINETARICDERRRGRLRRRCAIRTEGFTMKLLLVGSTGLVGRHVLDLALADPRVDGVTALARRALPAHPKLHAPRVDFDRLPEDAPWWRADAAICTLGTTMRAAGSRPAFRLVDHDYPLAVARIARRHGTPTYVLNSALGADPSSRFFYNRVKGELERDLAALGFASFTAVRPGLIGGHRDEFRAGERAAVLALTLFGPLLPRGWRLNPVPTIARALLDAALNPAPGAHLVTSDRLT